MSPTPAAPSEFPNSLLGGALGDSDSIGLRPTPIVSAGGSALVVAWVMCSLVPYVGR